jgi:hypothetical protein
MNQQSSNSSANSYKNILMTPADPKGPVKIQKGLFSEPVTKLENKASKNNAQKTN